MRQQNNPTIFGRKSVIRLVFTGAVLALAQACGGGGGGGGSSSGGGGGGSGGTAPLTFSATLTDISLEETSTALPIDADGLPVAAATITHDP